MGARSKDEESSSPSGVGFNLSPAKSATSSSTTFIVASARMQEFYIPALASGPMLILRWHIKSDRERSRLHKVIPLDTGSENSSTGSRDSSLDSGDSGASSSRSESSSSNTHSSHAHSSSGSALSVNSACSDTFTGATTTTNNDSFFATTSVLPLSGGGASLSPKSSGFPLQMTAPIVSALKTRTGLSKKQTIKPPLPARPAKRVGFNVPADADVTSSLVGARSPLAVSFPPSSFSSGSMTSTTSLLISFPPRTSIAAPSSSSGDTLDLDAINPPSELDAEAVAAAHEGHKLYSTPREDANLHHQQQHRRQQQEERQAHHEHTFSSSILLPNNDHSLFPFQNPSSTLPIDQDHLLLNHSDDNSHICHTSEPIVHNHVPVKGSPRRPKVDKSRAGSVASGRSGLSSSRGGASVASVLRNMLDTGSKTLEPSLVALRRALIFIFITTALMNLVVLITVRLQFTLLEHNIDTTAQHGDLAMSLQHLFSSVQMLAYASEGLYPLQPGDEANLRSDLSTAINVFSTLHYELFEEQGAGFSTVDEHNLYSNGCVLINDLKPGSYVSPAVYVTTNRTVNLLNAGVELASQATVILNLPLSSLNHANVNVFWVLFNAAGMRHPHDFLLFPLSTTFADKRSSNTNTVVVVVTWTVMAVALSMFAAVAVIIYIRVKSALKNKVEIFDVFLTVPQVGKIFTS